MVKISLKFVKFVYEGIRRRNTYKILGNFDLHRLVFKTKDTGDLSHAIGAVVEAEESIPICGVFRLYFTANF